jgi:signal transduction histidine kinase
LADSAPLAQGKSLALSLDAADGLQVSGDQSALAVLARNLVDNAIRYTPGGGQVHLSWQPEGSGALLRVDDSGPGIAPSDRERVFDRFVRGASAGETPGSGLGLAIVRSIAQRHRAALQLGSSDLGGLRVDVRFPRQD